jgi:uncharacterized short protein YbdD (DUF466 family)
VRSLLLRRARAAVAAFSDVLRGATGADAYRQYLAHHNRHHQGLPPLTREQFFRDSLESRWDGVKRCC